MNNRKKIGAPVRAFCACVAAVIAVCVLASCAASGSLDGGYGGAPRTENEGMISSPDVLDGPYYDYEKVSSDGSDPAAPEEKLVYTGSVNAQTKDDIDDAVAAVTAAVSGLGGYVSNANVNRQEKNYRGYSPTAELVCRVPSGSFDAFVSYIRDNMSVTGSTKNVSNITESYYSAKSAYETYLVQEQRLLELMKEAKGLEEMLLLEDKLTDVRRNIQYYETMLRTYDNKVEYATVSLYITQVVEYIQPEPVTFGERVGEAFRSSWVAFADGAKNFAVWFVGAVPTIIVLAVIVTAVILIVKGIVRSGRKKKARAAELEEQRRLEIVRKYNEEQARAAGNGETKA